MPTTTRCEKLLQDGSYCNRKAVARVIPGIEDPSVSTGWLACARHADRATAQLRRNRDDVATHVQPIDDDAFGYLMSALDAEPAD